jgi:hypothetical protein
VLLAPALAALGLLLRQNVRLALVVGVGMAITLLPWMARNVAVHDRPVAIKSTFWYVFWEGNNLQSNGSAGTQMSLETTRPLNWWLSVSGLEADIDRAYEKTRLIDSVIPAEALTRIQSQPREIDKMEWFREESIRTVREHPWHYLRMCGKRAFKLVWFDFTNAHSFTLQYRLSYVLLLLLAVTGVAANVPHPPRQLLVPAIMTLTVALVHVLVIMSARFRLPLEGMMLLPAAYGTVWVIATSRKVIEARVHRPAGVRRRRYFVSMRMWFLPLLGPPIPRSVRTETQLRWASKSWAKGRDCP